MSTGLFISVLNKYGYSVVMNGPEITDKGRRFTLALIESTISPAVLATALGETAQTINNWKNRGVPRNKAKKVALLLHSNLAGFFAFLKKINVFVDF